VGCRGGLLVEKRIFLTSHRLSQRLCILKSVDVLGCDVMCAYVQPVFDMECVSIPGGRGFKFISKPLSPEIVEDTYVNTC
jgi:hypothetical protein